MPLLQEGQLIAGNIQLTTGVAREINIDFQDVFLAASGVANATGASMSIAAPTASGPLTLLMAGASSGCFIHIPVGRVPQDIAIGTAAAASGQMIVDWTTLEGNSKAVTIAACLLLIPSGSEYTTTGASQRLGSACTTVTGASSGQVNSSSVMNFNVPANRTGLLALRFQVAGQDAATTTASSFYLYGIRLRYYSDRLGT